MQTPLLHIRSRAWQRREGRRVCAVLGIAIHPHIDQSDWPIANRNPDMFSTHAIKIFQASNTVSSLQRTLVSKLALQVNNNINTINNKKNKNSFMRIIIATFTWHATFGCI